MKATTKLLFKRLFLIFTPILLTLGVALLVTGGDFSMSVGDTANESGYSGSGCRGRHP